MTHIATPRLAPFYGPGAGQIASGLAGGAANAVDTYLSERDKVEKERQAKADADLARKREALLFPYKALKVIHDSGRDTSSGEPPEDPGSIELPGSKSSAPGSAAQALRPGTSMAGDATSTPSAQAPVGPAAMLAPRPASPTSQDEPPEGPQAESRDPGYAPAGRSAAPPVAPAPGPVSPQQAFAPAQGQGQQPPARGTREYVPPETARKIAEDKQRWDALVAGAPNIEKLYGLPTGTVKALGGQAAERLIVGLQPKQGRSSGDQVKDQLEAIDAEIKGIREDLLYDDGKDAQRTRTMRTQLTTMRTIRDRLALRQSNFELPEAPNPNPPNRPGEPTPAITQIVSRIRTEHPEWSPAQVKAEAKARAKDQGVTR